MSQLEDSGARRKISTTDRLIAGNYVLKNCIGLSGNAVVYRGHHQDLPGEAVAVKVLQPSLLKDQNLVQRFHREYASAAKISHPNVIRAFELVRSGETLAYSMELAENGDLAAVLKKGAISSIDQVLWIALQICAGLKAIHKQGYVHRDIKAENIFITKCGAAKVADFGVIHSSTEKPLTKVGEVLGTLRHLSPEGMTDGITNARSDIYALGLLIYEMVTGQFPFSGKGPIEVLTKRLNATPIAPIELRPDCPQELNDIILKTLEKDPDRRFQTVSSLLEAIRAINPTLAESSLRQRTATTPLFSDLLQHARMSSSTIPLVGKSEKFGHSERRGKFLYSLAASAFLAAGFFSGGILVGFL